MTVKAGAKAASWRDLPVQKRLEHALVKGIDEFAVVVRCASTLMLSPAPPLPYPKTTHCSYCRFQSASHKAVRIIGNVNVKLSIS